MRTSLRGRATHRPKGEVLRSLALVVLCCSMLVVRGQRYFFENIGVQQGLPASKAYCAAQGSDGVIWIGTETGLSSYDGVTVQTHGSADGVASGAIRALMVDKTGGVWAGHVDGKISHFNGNVFRTLSVGSGVKTGITGIVQTKDGAIYISSIGEGLWKAGELPAEGTNLPAERVLHPGDPVDHVLALAVEPEGGIGVLEDGGEMHLFNAGEWKAFSILGLEALFRPTCLFWDSRGDAWVGTQGGGAFHRSASGTVRYDITNGLRSNTVMCFGEDGKGHVWIGTIDGGAACVVGKAVRPYDLDNGLHGRFVRALVRDREGNLLICTNESGIDIFKGDRFVSYGEADGLVDQKVFAVMEDHRGRTWFGTNGGIVILDGAGRVSELITSQKGQLPTNFIRCLKEDDKGYVWIGTENAGLRLYDPRSGRESDAIEISGSLQDSRVTALEVGQPGEVWVGGLNGLRRYLPGSGTVPTVYTEEDGLAGNNVAAIYRDGKGSIWVGSTTNGITRIDNGKAQRIDLGSAFGATCFVEDMDGRIWVGTEGQGIVVVKDGKEVQRFTTQEGLLSNTIKALGRDGNGHVWIGTNKGLNKWRHKKQGFIAFTERAGFTGIEVKPNAVCALSSGGILFGTGNGATRVAGEKESDRSVPPLVTIRALKVNLEDRPMVMDMSLGHTERNLRVVYRSVALSDPGAVRYQYMLDGLDDDWQPVTTSTEANYPALPAGRYTFKVRAMDRTGEWTDPPAEFRFTMLPPWYRSWWFYTALVAAVSIILFSYIKVRERQLRMRNVILERKVDERTAEVVAQSKEIEGQKMRIEDLLLNILPKEISEELKENGRATARRYDQVTVMFTDMKGFTQVAEKMSPEELVNELDACFIHFDEIIGKYGIEKIKTIGDSYMSACGVPSPDEHHAVKAVMAAIEVRELMELWRKEHAAIGKQPWALRIGLHSGPVVAGVVGKRKFAYDIWGDAVNTASRMESSGEPGEVNISGATYELVKNYFECEHRGAVEAKNKGRIDMYFVRRLKAAYSVDPKGTRANDLLRKQLGIASEQFA